MTEHTATTRHIIDIVVTAPGDNGAGAYELIETIKRVLKMDGYYDVAYIGATEDVGLGGEEAAIVLNDGETYTGLDGCSIRRLDYVTYEKGLDYGDFLDEDSVEKLGDTLLEF